MDYIALEASSDFLDFLIHRYAVEAEAREYEYRFVLDDNSESWIIRFHPCKAPQILKVDPKWVELNKGDRVFVEAD